MNSRLALLISLAASAACAGGSTMRVAQEDGGDDAPVSLAPAPETETDSAAQTLAPPPAQAPIQDTAQKEQGYVPYGSDDGVQIRRIGQWTHTGIREARRTVIQDANAWAAFWSELGVGDRPAVDFSRDVVIAVAAGERPSGGHEIAVTKVTQRDGELRAEVTETAPGPNCLSTSALSQPVDVVVVQGVKPKSWSFVEQKEVRGCRP
jgi:hypothetical protein